MSDWKGIERLADSLDIVAEEDDAYKNMLAILRRDLEPLLTAADAIGKYRGKRHKDCGDKCDLNNLRKAVERWK